MTTLLGISALVVRVFKFLLVTDELYQFKYLNDVETHEDDIAITQKKAEAEDV